MEKVEMLPQRTVIAVDDGIVRICGMGISIIIMQEAGDRVTLGDCLRLAEEKGFDKDNDLALLVVAESERAGAVYNDPDEGAVLRPMLGQVVDLLRV